jgi:hypothetical protein
MRRWMNVDETTANRWKSGILTTWTRTGREAWETIKWDSSGWDHGRWMNVDETSAKTWKKWDIDYVDENGEGSMRNDKMR